jgi:hypothetical protein
VRAAGLSGFEIMLAVKAVKEEQLAVAPTADAALAPRPRATELRALTEALQHAVMAGNELTVASEALFSPARVTGPQHSYFGPDAPAPTLGLHELAQQAAAAAGLPPGCAVAVIGGAAQIEGLAARMDAELARLAPAAGAGRVLPSAPEAGWAGGALAAASWDQRTEYPEPWDVAAEGTGPELMPELGAGHQPRIAVAAPGVWSTTAVS